MANLSRPQKKEIPKPAKSAPIKGGTLWIEFLQAAKTTVSDPKKNRKKTFVKPDIVSAAMWQKYYQLGISLADFALDAFEVFASGDFTSWDKKRVKNMESEFSRPQGMERVMCITVCFSILLEALKEEEFFCCKLCGEYFFNDQVTVIHFVSSEHRKKETSAVRESGIDGVMRVIDSFVDLATDQVRYEKNFQKQRLERYGELDMSQAFRFFPASDFLNNWIAKYNHLTDPVIDPLTGQKSNDIRIFVGAVVKRVKGEIGRNAMAELRKYLEGKPTYCLLCRCITGGIEGFYGHVQSYLHITNIGKRAREETGDLNRVDLLTVVVNMHWMNFM